MSLKIDNIGWTVRKKDIVKDISFEVHEGEILGLVGPNGSGKSTLLRLIAGLRTPTTGKVWLNGQLINTMQRRSIAQTLAFVEQQADTSDAINVRDAVHIGRTPWLSPLAPWSDEDDNIVENALEAVNMTHRAEQNWQTLSGGERQRVHIARALAQQSEILLLDEPTNHLDIHHQISILSLVYSLRKTTLIALHDLNQAMGCDRVAVMKRGELIKLGPPDDILTPDCIEENFSVKANFITDPSDGSKIIRFS